jgi:5-methyltetrahydrofolate--homocysteine methyltransferase
MAEKVAEFAKEGWINLMGGCCGTTPEHIDAIAGAMRKFQPRVLPSVSSEMSNIRESETITLG